MGVQGNQNSCSALADSLRSRSVTHHTVGGACVRAFGATNVVALLLTHCPIKRRTSPQKTFTPRRRQVVTTAWECALRVRSICLLAVLVQALPYVAMSATAEAQTGAASVYSTESGSRTASGARLDPGALTAAHRSYPFGSQVRVTNRRNGRSVVVTINDRGPFVRGRIIDVTPAAARALGFSGLAQVTVERE